MPTKQYPPTTRVALAGLGAIGQTLARQIDKGAVPGLELTAVATRTQEKAEAFVATLQRSVAIVPLNQLVAHADVVIECAPAALLAEIAEPVLVAGKRLVVLSIGALLRNPRLQELAAEHGGAIFVPTGALIGLDAVNAAAEGTIHSVRMITRKPPIGLLGAPYLIEHDIEVVGITEPLRVFTGSAREAARGFPANLNVAVALSLAGIGPDRTTLEIWADPNVTRNTHRIEVESDSASFNMTIENIPSENPKTGVITARSVLALLRKMSAPVRIGT